MLTVGVWPHSGSGVDGPVKRDEYHLVAEYLPNGMVRTTGLAVYAVNLRRFR